MKKHIVCIASEQKGNEFLEECQSADWYVTLVTRKKLLDEPWAWTALNDVRTVENEASMEDYVRAVTNIAGERKIDRVVGLDEFDVTTAARTREHLQLGGMTFSHTIRFRDKLAMRNIANAAGIPCPDFICPLNPAAINEFLENVEMPVIVKPRHEVSAFGIRKCEDAGQVWDVLTDLDSRNNWRDHPSQFLIERFIEGDVFHVDSVVSKGKVICSGVSKYGRPPFSVTHYGGVFTTSIVEYGSKERKDLEKLNAKLLKAFNYENGVTHGEFIRSKADGKFYLLEVACRVGGAYIANVLEHACGFNLWREWAKISIADGDHPYSPPKLRKDYAGIALALSKDERPDTAHYTDEEIVYRINKPKHVGLIFYSPKRERVSELLEIYSQRIADDFLAIAPAKERYDD
ncbi:acetyl-CoA carboxylase biotin carboxylase subunit family protein [Leptolyngbya sp. 7M]|uniref:ATP-grasp domain-containing protein n=1 Tax=Leptolyngbya sp. 7M TaxID=2812896 RepID=UPI001B8AAAA0|nr:ATP-grasp domain-containing protein [Leptolyngbya sp. 7M]QYO65447.1 ATP-grasp domain-containing protein [Leptolyngbya sp. 7M]